MDNDDFYTLQVTIPQLDNLVQQRLVEAARDIEYLKDPNDVEVWEALMVVIPHFSSPEQIKELAYYQADAEWVNIVKEHNDKKD